MITIDKVSERAKQRVITIFDQEGVTERTLRICATGLIADQLSDGKGLYNITDPEEMLETAVQVAKILETQRRDYSELALRIYGYHITESHVNGEIEKHFGPKS